MFLLSSCEVAGSGVVAVAVEAPSLTVLRPALLTLAASREMIVLAQSGSMEVTADLQHT